MSSREVFESGAGQSLATANMSTPSLLQGPVGSRGAVLTLDKHIGGVVIGELLAFTGDGLVPLVSHGACGTPCVQSARSIVDIHADHIGRAVVLMFERGDPEQPIVMGLLRQDGNAASRVDGRVEIDADGQRVVVSAEQQLVLRCGRASITLTKAGKILIDGSYVSSNAAGVNRLKGGSVQLN